MAPTEVFKLISPSPVTSRISSFASRTLPKFPNLRFFIIFVEPNYRQRLTKSRSDQAEVRGTSFLPQLHDLFISTLGSCSINLEFKVMKKIHLDFYEDFRELQFQFVYFKFEYLWVSSTSWFRVLCLRLLLRFRVLMLPCVLPDFVNMAAKNLSNLSNLLNLDNKIGTGTKPPRLVSRDNFQDRKFIFQLFIKYTCPKLWRSIEKGPYVPIPVEFLYGKNQKVTPKAKPISKQKRIEKSSKPKIHLVFILAKKDETTKILKKFVTLIENQTNLKVKVIRTDNETESRNQTLIEFCDENGIAQQYNAARTP
ncbi:hypothetical protein E3N88_12215 [Mikania micrantha]|uniref:Uncharacterized protein n=1 Tax=Mikania micrantha TaxID=192012 RepID=A0A5N6P7F7_9ASTR|nr:hypothetical protein E3N88_12215 [Mikania micrantha]